MLQIGDYIISLDLLQKKFACDLQACYGNCCRYGDAGAPLEEEEVKILEEIKTLIYPYLREEGRRAIDQQGTRLKDIEGENVTPLIEERECAYTYMENGIFKCAIEKAWNEGIINFRKPLSCHLFPVRIKKYNSFKAVNVEEWTICSGGREKGGKDGIYLYRFLEEALKRALGEDIFEQICITADQIKTLR